MAFIADAQANIPVGNHNLIIGADYKLSRANIIEINLQTGEMRKRKLLSGYSIDGNRIYFAFAQAEINIIRIKEFGRTMIISETLEEKGGNVI